MHRLLRIQPPKIAIAQRLDLCDAELIDLLVRQSDEADLVDSQRLDLRLCQRVARIGGHLLKPRIVGNATQLSTCKMRSLISVQTAELAIAQRLNLLNGELVDLRIGESPQANLVHA